MVYKRHARGRNKLGRFHRYKQRGRTNYKADNKRKAKNVGWRTSRAGRKYFENRRNRSDQFKWI